MTIASGQIISASDVLTAIAGEATNRVLKVGDSMTGTLTVTCSGLAPAHLTSQTGSGVATASAFPNFPHAGFAYNYKNITSDAVVLDASQTSIGRGIVFGDAVDVVVAGSGVNGARIAHGAFMRVNVSPATEQNFIGANWHFAQASVPVQGATSSVPKGNLYGANPQVQLAAGATNWVSILGEEVDVEVDSGANVQYKFGSCITTIGNDAVQGSLLDAALHIGAVPSTGGWKNGIVLSRFNGNGVPIDPVNGAVMRTQDTWGCYMGIDLRATSFSGYSFASNGFSVSGVGDLNAANAGFSATLTVAGPSNFVGQVNAVNMVLSGNTSVAQTLNVTGASNFVGQLNAVNVVLSGNANIAQTLNVTGSSNFAGASNFVGQVNAANAVISGNVSIAQTINVVGQANFQGQMVANDLSSAGNVSIAQTLHVTGQTAVSGGLNIGYITPPSTANATGVLGQFAWDSSYIYMCVATNSWKRIAISSW